MRYITIALAKGRLAKNALDIFEHIGIKCDEMKDEKTKGKTALIDALREL